MASAGMADSGGIDNSRHSEKKRVGLRDLQLMLSEFISDQKDRRGAEKKIDPLDKEEAYEIIEVFMQNGIFPSVTVPEEHLSAILKDGLRERATSYQPQVSAIVGTLGIQPFLPEKKKRAVLELRVPVEKVQPRFTGSERIFQGVVHINMRHVSPEQIRVVSQA